MFKLFSKKIENQNEEKIVVVVHSNLSLENPIRPMPEAKKRKGNSFRNGNMSPSALQVQKNKTQEIQERESIVLWKRPIVTLSYCIGELVINLKECGQKLWERKSYVMVFLISLIVLVGLCSAKGPHQLYVQIIQKQLWWCSYWVWLGVLSSAGFGFGLHTFLLYLGPHIASVTLAAYECGTLNFPQPPYPDEIVCPEDDSVLAKLPITLWNIMSKVRLEAFMWGVGTAIGELPPYFMARTARLSGIDTEGYEEPSDPQSIIGKIKVWIQKLIEKVGFFGILACASIPNPLFDLAGVFCGHFLVPFWTFFGATLIGKAIIKMHIQKLFVIIAFDEALVEKAVNVTEHVPYIGKYINAPFRDFLEKQKANFHRKTSDGSFPAASWLSRIFDYFMIGMIVCFLLSIVNSLAQRYHKRLLQKQKENAHKRAKD